MNSEYQAPHPDPHISDERSGSVVESLTRDRRAGGSSLTGSLYCVLEQEH